jgi:agmatinase
MSETHDLWGDLRKHGSQPADTTFSIIGIPYDRSASTRLGAALAPERLRHFSHHLTPVTEDRTRLGRLSVCDLGDIAIDDQVRDFEKVRETVAALPNIPILIGGDHSVTIPIFQGQRQRFAGKRLGVLWVDAHPDLCDVFDGSALSHACVLRRGIEAGIEQRDICMVGLRSWELPEVEYIDNSQINVYAMPQVAELGIQAIAAEVRQKLSECDAVHISLDIDCLDPAAAPGTGIPDAGGMTMREVLTLIKAMQGLPLVGLDVVEVSPPIDPSEATVFAALKIIMEFMGVIARSA